MGQSARSSDDDVRVHCQERELLFHVLPSNKCAVAKIGVFPDFLRELKRLKSEFASDEQFNKWLVGKKMKEKIK